MTKKKQVDVEIECDRHISGKSQAKLTPHLETKTHKKTRQRKREKSAFKSQTNVISALQVARM